ncbi:tetraspanin-8-like [Cheilinus undulatus]|uniref:tetraspanin-8-like n=1 Tax=Cheilinus undulatus TaxID=241271 RepID=UPI001BD44B42|nr:tetraspanin-8-like [Cheilinus undulatus]
MTKINGCLKCVFIFFNVLYAVLGCVLIYGVIKATILSAQLSAFGTPGLGWGWVFAIGMLGVSCLGIYAAASEKTLFLKIFAGFMGVGMVIMLIFGIVVVVQRNKVKEVFDMATRESVQPYLESEELRTMLIELQGAAQCCGISGASDWGDNIPQSCECNKQYGYTLLSAPCKDKPLGTSGPNKIWGQSCKDFIFSYLELAFKIFMGFCFGFAVTALLGLLITLLMIHQVNRHDGMGGPTIAMKGY